jgi:hypothetical protein
MDLPVVAPIKNYLNHSPTPSARHFLLHQAHDIHWHFQRRVDARRWSKGKNLGICVFVAGEEQQNTQTWNMLKAQGAIKSRKKSSL